MRCIDFEYYWYTEPIDGKVYGVPEILQEADSAGIDMVVLVPGPLFRPDNVGVAQAAKNEPRLIPCCQVNPQFGDEAVQELETAVREWGMRSLKLMPLLHGYAIDGSVPVRVLDKARDLGIPVNIHSGSYGCQPSEIAVVAARYPEMPIIMDHMGYRDHVPQAIEAAKRHRNIYLGTTCVTAEASIIKWVVEEVGADRVVFGSNGPGVFVDLAVEAHRRLQLGREAEDLVMGGNLARIYGID